MEPISLNDNELEALRILWEMGELKPAGIQAHFAWPIDNGTLRSVLVKLADEKYVTRRLQGKAFFYAARMPKQTLLQSLMRRLAKVFSGGSEQELVVQMVKTTDMKPADIDLLRQIATSPPAPQIASAPATASQANAAATETRSRKGGRRSR